MEVNEKKYSIFQNTVYLAKESWIFERRIIIFTLITSIMGIAIPLYGIYLPKISVDLLVQKASISKIALTLGELVISFLVINGVNSFLTSARYFHYNDMRNCFLQKIFFSSLDCKYAMAESSEYRQLYQRAVYTVSSGDNSASSVFYAQIPLLIISFASFILYSGILSSLHYAVVILLLLTSAITYFFQRKENIYYERTKDEYAEVGKKLHYTINQCGRRATGKDIRVYGMGGWLIWLIKKLQGEQHRILKERRMQGYKTQIANGILNFLRDGLAYTYLIFQTVQGNIGIGDFVLYFGAITGFSGWISQIIRQLGYLKTANIQMNDLRTFIEVEPENMEAAQSILPDVSNGIEIQFDHVYFSYPGSEKETIHDMSFHIKNGEHIALVGLNGAGKTTLVKLLTGLYEPDKGRILINGADLRKLAKKDIYTLFSTVFQDRMLLPFMLDENIALVRKEKIDNERVEKVLRLSGLSEDLMERGITKDTYIFKQLTNNGIFLSGGQEQKLLLARALYKEAPALILDEPTAALDPLAEKALYEKYKELCGGRTAIFISHRLASTQFSDRVFYMKNGCISECGSHEELLQKGGEYAHLYEVQSHYYNVSDKERGEQDECEE